MLNKMFSSLVHFKKVEEDRLPLPQTRVIFSPGSNVLSSGSEEK